MNPPLYSITPGYKLTFAVEEAQISHIHSTGRRAVSINTVGRGGPVTNRKKDHKEQGDKETDVHNALERRR